MLAENYRDPLPQDEEGRVDHIARRLVFFSTVTIGMLALAACGGDEPAPTTTPAAQSTPTPGVTGNDGQGGGAAAAMTVTGAEYAFDAPGTVAAGRRTVRFRNEGQEVHELHVMRFNEGVLIHQIMGTLHGGGGLDAALQMASSVEHVAAIGPGQTAEGTVNLPEGEYVLICQVPSPGDGVTHVLKGMAKPLTVTAAP
jgi:plastocyanin